MGLNDSCMNTAFTYTVNPFPPKSSPWTSKIVWHIRPSKIIGSSGRKLGLTKQSWPCKTTKLLSLYTVPLIINLVMVYKLHSKIQGFYMINISNNLL